MLNRFAAKGAQDALAKFALEAPPGMLGGLLDKAKSFGSGQLGAAKSLFANVRGGMGGAPNPEVISGAVPAASGNPLHVDPQALARGTQRHEALGNLRTLAPSLLAGGGLYLHHRAKQQQEQQAQQQMPPQGYPMM